MEKEILKTKIDRRLIIYLKIMDEQYKPIPVSRALEIGEEFDKDQVLIFAYDNKRKYIHATSWGRSQLDKRCVAQLSEIISNLLGGDPVDKVIFEDPGNLLTK